MRERENTKHKAKRGNKKTNRRKGDKERKTVEEIPLILIIIWWRFRLSFFPDFFCPFQTHMMRTKQHRNTRSLAHTHTHDRNTHGDTNGWMRPTICTFMIAFERNAEEQKEDSDGEEKTKRQSEQHHRFVSVCVCSEWMQVDGSWHSSDERIKQKKNFELAQFL